MTKKQVKKQTERAMYLSIISTVLCMFMLIGMTFAWFSSSVESGQNVITTAPFEVQVLWNETLPTQIPETSTDAATAGWKTLDTGIPFNEDAFLPGQEVVRYIALYNKSPFDVKFDVSLRAVTTVTTGTSDLLNALEIYTKETTTTVTTADMGDGKTASALQNNDTAALVQIASAVVGETTAPDETVKVIAVAVKLPGNYSAADSQSVKFFIKVIASQWDVDHGTESYATVNSALGASFVAYDAPAENQNTTVAITDIDAAANTAVTLSVQTDSTDVAASKFSVAAGQTAVAGIDLTLTDASGDPVTFDGGTATITTYIAKNLDGVSVIYNGTGSDPTDIDYDPATGRLTFKTTHFSEYVVTSTSTAYVKSKDKAYDSLPAAVEAAVSGDTVILLKDVTLGKISSEDNVAISVTKDLTIDGNNNTLTTTATRGIWVDDSNVDLTIKNLTINGSNLERAIQVNPNFTGVKLTIDNVNATVSYYTVNFCSGTIVDVKISNSVLKGWAALNIWSNGVSVRATDCVFDCNTISANELFGAIVLEADTTEREDLASSNMTVELTRCTIKATGSYYQVAVQFNGSGRSSSSQNTVTLNDCNIICDTPIGSADEGGNIPAYLISYDKGNDNSLVFNNSTLNGYAFDTEAIWSGKGLVAYAAE